MWHFFLRRRCLLLLLPCLAGCGRGYPPCGVVVGNITIDGKPVDQGQICFFPESGRPATGAVQPDGSYRLTTFDPEDGAIIGRHRISLDVKRISYQGKIPQSFEEEVAQMKQGGSPKDYQLHWLVPEKYSRAETSGLTVDVKPGENRINFQVSKQGEVQIDVQP